MKFGFKSSIHHLMLIPLLNSMNLFLFPSIFVSFNYISANSPELLNQELIHYLQVNLEIKIDV